MNATVGLKIGFLDIFKFLTEYAWGDVKRSCGLQKDSNILLSNREVLGKFLDTRWNLSYFASSLYKITALPKFPSKPERMVGNPNNRKPIHAFIPE